MWYAEQALSLPMLTMGTGNLVDLENDKFLASYSLAKKLKNSTSKLSIDGLILLVFVNSPQIFSGGLLAIAINKVQSFSYNLSQWDNL